MQITVTIPDEVVTLAQARGLTPESYVEGLIAEQAVPQTLQEAVPEMTDEEFNAAMDRLARYSDQIPILPLEAISRESLYDDHD
jgi:hypothetical protein